jgi:hypothetical protein
MTRGWRGARGRLDCALRAQIRRQSLLDGESGGR